MKYFINTLLIMAIFNILSCDEYLSEAPDNRQEVSTPQALSGLLVKAYPFESVGFVERMSDNITAINSVFISRDDGDALLYAYESPKESVNRRVGNFWLNFYYAIAQANLALEMIDQVPHVDSHLKSSIRGEALLCRAYNHFMLANVFCQAYSEQAEQDLGIPYLTSIEKELLPSYERGTLKETYAKIEKDLLEGLSFIRDDYYKGAIAKYHFSKNSALALASRFFLFKGDYEKCIKYSNQLLGEGTLTTTLFIRDGKEVFQKGTLNEVDRKFQSLSAPSNLLVMRKGCIVCHGSQFEANDSIFNSVFTANIQERRDYRDIRVGQIHDPFGPRRIPKYHRRSGIFTVLRSEEVIFNRMESYVRLEMEGKRPDGIAQALADYHVMAPLRYATPGHLFPRRITNFFRGSTPEAMIKFILSERRKEFFGEGIRWFDIKRHRMPVIHKNGNAVYRLRAKDPKKALQIPQPAIVNGIQKNPGWDSN